jgi:hypothetical protein
MNAYKMFSGDKGSGGETGQGASSGENPNDMINNAMGASKMFSGDKGTSGGSASGSGGIFDNIGMLLDDLVLF